ncbi:hypothetical protein PVNG_06610 [Plasmodium vivax North Korean]|uniref:Uncharacterized protein n=1 Tax=Plasmodium vivax North Korean TaxID=1035514 RepID=A0A0J9U0X2_PLAVI|nr:hypothetical protein PVNG_06610 [Plasmodium vivax North Korean]
MEEDVYIGMKFLYEYYQLYDEISSGYFWITYNHCENLSTKIFNYNHSIEVYYDKNRDLYNKISPYAKLIEEMIKQSPKKCDGNLTFRIPPKFLKDEEIRLQKEEAEKQKIQQEADRKRIQEEEDRKRTQQIQQELESRKIMQPVTTNYGVQREGLHEAEPQLLAQFGHSRETENLESQQPSRALRYRWRLDNSGRLEHLKEQVSGQPYEDQLDTGVLKPENEDTNTDGSLLKSLKLPSAITEVLGSVDPVPVVGVSGGMGALFLLFREEEDAFIEFPVVSMDHSQEDFQDMKIMMVGILDIAQ